MTTHRSSADGRDSYYSIDLDACRNGLQTAGAALHPPSDSNHRRLTPAAVRSPRPRVLFLCTGNSARSQIAEALLEQMSGGTIDADSAGSNPKPLHPNAVSVLADRGIDIGANRSKHVDEFAGQRFDTVITLCDRIREVCPPFRSQPEQVHWSIPDPSLEAATDELTYPRVRTHRRRTGTAHRLSVSTCSTVTRTTGEPDMSNDELVSVRYLVNDVAESVTFYTEHLDFEILNNFAPAFADVKRGNLRLLLSGPTSSAGRPMDDGTTPRPGGWNRIHLIVDDIDREVARLTDAGTTFRNPIVDGPGGRQVLLQDPSDNFIELFQPAGT